MTKDVDVVYIAGSRLLKIAITIFGKSGTRHVPGSFFERSLRAFRHFRADTRERCVDIPGQWRIIRRNVLRS